jgi:hypothetical protein
VVNKKRTNDAIGFKELETTFGKLVNVLKKLKPSHHKHTNVLNKKK